MLGDGSERKKWELLPGMKEEPGDIRKVFGQQQLAPNQVMDLRGEMATEEAFRLLAPGSRYIHVATHGFFAPPDKKSALRSGQADEFITSDHQPRFLGYSPGLLSGIVLAGANNPPKLPDDPLKYDEVPDDGILTADEISSLSLEGTELVVLSACETGLGEVAGSEGLLGLQRAFQVAGAKNTIATLWKVDDAATRNLMRRFYENHLQKKLSPVAALHEAQLWALNHPDEAKVSEETRGAQQVTGPLEDANKPLATTKRLDPKYWAAFTISISSLDALGN